MSQGRIAAVTGGTGFFGRWIVCALAEAGWRPRLLVRRDPLHPQLNGVDYEIVPGDMADAEALLRLVQGAGAVVHAAGAIKALSRQAFFAANADATACFAQIAARAAPEARFVLVSSLAAREPELSSYAASKAAGEEMLHRFGPRNAVVVRPSAIYGPWDRETLPLFRAARGPLMAVPKAAAARICLIHAADAAAAVAALCQGDSGDGVLELSDGRFDGYDWRTIATEARCAVDGSARLIALPAAAIRCAALVSGGFAKVLHRPAMLTAEKAMDILHLDWSSAPGRQPSPDVWQPTLGLREGFRNTARWYQVNRWLPNDPLVTKS